MKHINDMQGVRAAESEIDVMEFDKLLFCNDSDIEFESVIEFDTKFETKTRVLKHIQQRLKDELCLLALQWRMWLLCLFIDIYCASMLFRNLAFYGFRAGPRLTQDLGHALLPEWKGFWTDQPMYVLRCVLLIASGMTFVPQSRSKPVCYVVNIWRRWGMMIAMGNILRFLTYISTTLPGSAAHCLPSNSNIENDQPKTLYNILFRITLDGNGDGTFGTYNCGDLTFSGHILMTMTYAFCCVRYVPNTCAMTAEVEHVFKIFVWCIVIVQCLFTIMARNHYTMDVIIALYLTPLLWSFYTTRMEPKHIALGVATLSPIPLKHSFASQ